MNYDAAEFLESGDTARWPSPPQGADSYSEVVVTPDGHWASDDGQSGEVTGWAAAGAGPRFLRAFVEARATAGWALVTLAPDGGGFRLIFARRLRT